MTPIVEHKNGDRRLVRDDLAEEYVICVPCKGRGTTLFCVGEITEGLTAYRTYPCAHCGGLSIWRVQK